MLVYQCFIVNRYNSKKKKESTCLRLYMTLICATNLWNFHIDREPSLFCEYISYSLLSSTTTKHLSVKLLTLVSNWEIWQNSFTLERIQVQLIVVMQHSVRLHLFKRKNPQWESTYIDLISSFCFTKWFYINQHCRVIIYLSVQ